jgi:hypothetical protein
MLNYIMVMDAMRKIPTTLTLDPMLVHRLDQAAADRDRSRSWLAGRAIEAFLESPSVQAVPSSATPAPFLVRTILWTHPTRSLPHG